ncbi:MAG: phage virion morphogenesis protein [Candidatus Accumulibacter sp.]|jgi:phage virion morphogenesis protein|nr:phage virion morphogenesis protein [Accumulibacter sp.]
MSETIEGMERLDHTLDSLAAALSPAGRRKLGLKIGQQIRRTNVARIGKNIAPDGTPFTPRIKQKPKGYHFKYKSIRGGGIEKTVAIKSIVEQDKRYLVAEGGKHPWRFLKERMTTRIKPITGGKKLRKKMFAKLKATQHMRLVRTADEITLTFKSRTGRIAAIHHFGLRDQVGKNRSAQYAARPLLGFSKADRDAIDDLLLAHVAEGIR